MSFNSTTEALEHFWGESSCEVCCIPLLSSTPSGLELSAANKEVEWKEEDDDDEDSDDYVEKTLEIRQVRDANSFL